MVYQFYNAFRAMLLQYNKCFSKFYEAGDGKCAENKQNISFKIASLLDKGEYQCDHLQKLWITVTENHLVLITLRTPFVISNNGGLRFWYSLFYYVIKSQAKIFDSKNAWQRKVNNSHWIWAIPTMNPNTTAFYFSLRCVRLLRMAVSQYFG